MMYRTRKTFVLSTVVFVLTDMGLSNHADDMNDILTTAYTIKKKAVNQNWTGRNRRKEINISQMFNLLIDDTQD